MSSPDGVPVMRVNTYTNGTIGPSEKTLGPVDSGSTIMFDTAPGCWGPMITPKFKGGHEVTQPLAIRGADVGDAIAVEIKKIRVTSAATASGTDSPVSGRFIGDPFVARKCPACGIENPETDVHGIGQEAIRCRACGAECSPFRVNGYTIVFDHDNGVGITVGEAEAERIARKCGSFASLPPQSSQHSILVFALHDMPGVAARLRPFIGNIGTTPAIDMPTSHNAGDFGQFLINAPHSYGITRETLDSRTDGHMDIDSVREGAILICPVKHAGGGLYVGDMHAMQGDGEIAGHTTDVSGEVTVEVSVLKGLAPDGPILLPCKEDLPFLSTPLTDAEWDAAIRLAERCGVVAPERNAPLQFIGTGANLNDAADNGLERAARLLQLTLDEVKNRVTIGGAVEIGRLPGVVTVTVPAPLERLRQLGIAEMVRHHYGLVDR